MTVFLLLFRGVGGATQLPVAPLRASLSAAGFAKAATYINSGNALVESGLSRQAVLAAVTELCAAEFGFRKAVHVVTRAEWRRLVDDNPFPEAVQGRSLHAAVLAAEPEPGRVEALRSRAGEAEGFAVVGRVAYLHTPQGFATSKLARRFDRGIGVPATARNWNTVRRLMDLADEAAS